MKKSANFRKSRFLSKTKSLLNRILMSKYVVKLWIFMQPLLKDMVLNRRNKFVRKKDFIFYKRWERNARKCNQFANR